MKPGQSIKVQLVDNNGNPLPIADVEIGIQFLIRGQKVYQFALGLTDSSGVVTASYADFEEKRQKEAQFFLMDYNTKLDDTDPSVRILLESGHEITRRREYAARIFGPQRVETGIGYSNELLEPQDIIVRLGGEATVVHLHTRRA